MTRLSIFAAAFLAFATPAAAQLVEGEGEFTITVESPDPCSNPTHLMTAQPGDVCEDGSIIAGYSGRYILASSQNSPTMTWGDAVLYC